MTMWTLHYETIHVGKTADCYTGGQVVFKYFVCLVTSASSLIERSEVISAKPYCCIHAHVTYLSVLVPYIDTVCHKSV